MIGPFKGEYDFLSNFYRAPVVFKTFTYPTNEHWYQAHKARISTTHRHVIEAMTPAEAKRRGRGLTMSSSFERDKHEIMLFGLILKFRQHPILAQRLVATGNEELVEINSWGDQFWGAVYTNNGLVGENHLGKSLMQVRKMLR